MSSSAPARNRRPSTNAGTEVSRRGKEGDHPPERKRLSNGTSAPSGASPSGGGQRVHRTASQDQMKRMPSAERIGNPRQPKVSPQAGQGKPAAQGMPPSAPTGNAALEGDKAYGGSPQAQPQGQPNQAANANPMMSAAAPGGYGGFNPYGGGAPMPQGAGVNGGVSPSSMNAYGGGMAPGINGSFRGMPQGEGQPQLSMYDMNPYGMGSMAAANGNMSGYGSNPAGMSFLSGAGLGGSMYGMGSEQGSAAERTNSLYSMGGMGNSMYGPMGSMYGMGGGGSMYGPMGGGMGGGSMYGPMGGGSMYGMGGGSMYGMGGGSMYGGSGYFGGSIYGGRLFGSTGSIYGQGGSLYGSNDPASVMGSMYGIGSMYESFRPHTSLGVVRKYDAPYMYTFQSNLGTTQASESFRKVSFYRPSLREGGDELNGSVRKLEEPARPKSSEDRAADAPAATAPSTTEADKEKSSRTSSTEDAESSKKLRAGARNKDKRTKKEELAAPKASPQSARGTTDRGTSLNANYKVHTVAVIEKTRSSNPAVSSNGTRLIIKKDDKQQDVDFEEVVSYSPIDDEVHSKRVTEMLDHYLAGHNAGLLVADDQKATAASSGVVRATFRKLMERLDADVKGTKNEFFLNFSFCAARGATEVKDLLKEGATYESLQMGGSPLFGPVIMKVESKPAKGLVELEKMLQTAEANSGKDEGKLWIGSLILKQVKRPASGSGDHEVFLSSLLLAISKDGAQPFEDALNKTSDKVPADAFRYALGGPGVTVSVVCVQDTDGDCGALVGQAGKLGEITNSAPRSGNVRRFVDYTEAQHTKIKSKIASSSGNEKTEWEKNAERLGQILRDAKELLESPIETTPKVYRANSKDHKENESDKASPAPREPAKAAVAPKADDKAQKDNAASAAATEDKDVHADEENSVATVVVVEDKASPTFKVEEDGKHIKTTDKGTVYNVNEVIEKSAITSTDLGSARAKQSIEKFTSGANAAVLSLDGAAAVKDPFQSVLWSAVRQATKAALQEDSQTRELRASITLLTNTGEAMDLVNGGSMSKLVVASSPLYGPVSHNSSLHRLFSMADFEGLVLNAKKNIGDRWGNDTAIFFSLINCFTNAKDTYVSSFVASIAGANEKLYENILSHRSPLSYLYRYALGGTASTTVLVSLGKEDPAPRVEAFLSALKQVGETKNRSLRLGSISDFVRYTKSSLEKRRARIESMADSKEKEANQKLIHPMEQMLQDHEQTLKDINNNFPRAYASGGNYHRHGNAEKEGSSKQNALTNAVASPSPDTANPSSNAAPDASKAADFSKPRVVAVVDKAVQPDEKKLTLGSKDFAVDEVIQRSFEANSVKVSPSKDIGELESVFANVHNSAIISASTCDHPLANEPVWLFFQKVLTMVLQEVKEGEKVAVDLSFSLVSSTELVADLLQPAKEGANTPRALLEIASSPLYGPKIHNASSVRLEKSEEVAKTVQKALEAASAHEKLIRDDNVLMIATAVQRHQTADGDVQIASLTATLSGASAVPYSEVLHKTAVPRRFALAGAYGGPCSTVTLLNCGDATEKAQSMASVLTELGSKQSNLACRSGSVEAFIKYTEGALKQEKEHQATGDNAARQERKVARLETMIREHRAILKDYSVTIPAYVSTHAATDRDKQHASSASPDAARETETSAKPAADAGATSSSTKVRTVAVLTQKRASAEVASSPPTGSSRITKTDDTHIAATLEGKERAVEFDEVVERADAASTVRSKRIDTLVANLLEGYNTALLTCDVPGSNSGLTVGKKVVSSVFSSLPPSAELYVSITVHKDNTRKDFLSSGGTYVPLELSTSPLFGPCVTGAAMVQLKDAADFDKTFTAAVTEAVHDQSLCVACFVLKQIKQDAEDVVESGLLITVDGEHAAAYGRAAAVKNKHDRGIFQYALGGSCHTVATLGCPDYVDSTKLTASLDVLESLGAIKCGALRNGGLKRFLQFSQEAVKGFKARIDKTSDTRQKESYQRRLDALQEMCNDAKDMIANPTGKVPHTYSLHSGKKTSATDEL